MFPILHLGPLAVQVPGLILLIGLWVGLSLSEKEAQRLTLKPDAIYNLVLISLVAGVIGARLAYALRYLSAYAADPLGLVSLNPLTLSLSEGVIFGLIAALIYGRRSGLPLRPTLDALAPTLAVMLVALAASHIASGDAFGAPARLPWSIYLWEDYRHPSQFYELFGALIVLGAWWQLRLKLLGAGSAFLLVAGLSAFAALFLEAFRGDSLITIGGLRTIQLWALVILAGCLVAMRRWREAASVNG